MVLILLKRQQDLPKRRNPRKYIDLIKSGAPKTLIKASGGIKTTAAALASILKKASLALAQVMVLKY